MNRKRSVKYLWTGLACFFAFLIICIIIRPSGLTMNSGISYYGGYINTLLPYSLAFLINSVLIWKVALIIGRESKIDAYVGLSLKLISILLIGVLITPHMIFSFEHKIIGSTLFSVQLILVLSLITFVYRDWINVMLLIVAFLSGLASLIYLSTPTGFMIESQLIFQISIWSIFIRYLER